MTQEEKAADKHIRKVVDAAGHPGWDWTTQDISEAFIAGAKWQKEQMLKEAVEGSIRSFGFHNAISIKDPGRWTEKLDKYKYGDEIIVIVLPKEEPTNG